MDVLILRPGYVYPVGSWSPLSEENGGDPDVSSTILPRTTWIAGNLSKPCKMQATARRLSIDVGVYCPRTKAAQLYGQKGWKGSFYC